MEESFPLAESILDQMANAVIYADVSGTIRRSNRAAAALFGYNPAQALGETSSRSTCGQRTGVASKRP
jgi:PAS domain S-box-containing protein